MNNITPTNKDRLLLLLCENCDIERHVDFPKESMEELIDIDNSTINSFLQQFDRMGLLEYIGESWHSFSFILYVDAVDFINRGGFAIQEDLLVNNIKKLLKEVDNLKPSFTEQADRIASIASAIMSALSFIIKK